MSTAVLEVTMVGALQQSELSPAERLVAFQKAFWKFLRPHTIRGTILGSCAVTARALIESPVVRASAQSLPAYRLHVMHACIGCLLVLVWTARKASGNIAYA